MYAIMMLLGTITACKYGDDTLFNHKLDTILIYSAIGIMLSPGLASAMNKVPFCEPSSQDSSFHVLPDTLKVNCGIAAGYLAVYRLCFGMTLFFLFMALIMIGVRNSKDPRAGIQNG